MSSSSSRLETLTPLQLLAELAPTSAATWHALGAEIFSGDVTVTTDNNVYRFEDGVIVGRATTASDSFECPASMRELRLIGFLHDEGGLWSISSRWRKGSHAVLWKPADAFILTSPTRSFTKDADPGPKPTPWVSHAAPSHSGVRLRHVTRPPRITPPQPPSMTRIHRATPVALAT
jgi:hypothetical protein